MHILMMKYRFISSPIKYMYCSNVIDNVIDNPVFVGFVPVSVWCRDQDILVAITIDIGDNQGLSKPRTYLQTCQTNSDSKDLSPFYFFISIL